MKTMKKPEKSCKPEQLKTIIFVAPDGSHLVNPKAEPSTTDMVLRSYSNKLVVESTVDGNLTTKPQRDRASELIADWLGKRRRMMTAAKGNFSVFEKIVDDDGYAVPQLIIQAPSGRPDETQLNRVIRHAIKWLNATGNAPKAEDPKDPDEPDEPKTPDEPKEPKTPEPKQPDSPKPAEPKQPEPKTPEPKQPEPKEPKEPKAPEPKQPEPKQPDPPKPAEPESSPKWDGILWDPNKSIEENLDSIMGKED